MTVEILLGSALILISLILAGMTFWALEALLMRHRDWLIRPPHRPRLILVLVLSALSSLWLMTVGVWIWALAFHVLGLFPSWEAAVYFSLTAFTTLGFSDLVLPLEWRLLAGMAAANGLLTIGLLIAVQVEAVRHVRLAQLSASNI